MAAETSWHRYGTKLRHCHPMYILARPADTPQQQAQPQHGGLCDRLLFPVHQCLFLTTSV